MFRISVSEGRAKLPELIDKVRGDAVLLERHGAPVAVMISPARYEQLLAAYDEVSDVALLDGAIADGSTSIPWEQVRSDLGW